MLCHVTNSSSIILFYANSRSFENRPVFCVDLHVSNSTEILWVVLEMNHGCTSTWIGWYGCAFMQGVYNKNWASLTFAVWEQEIWNLRCNGWLLSFSLGAAGLALKNAMLGQLEHAHARVHSVVQPSNITFKDELRGKMLHCLHTLNELWECDRGSGNLLFPSFMES
jgi:hypothetical protein